MGEKVACIQDMSYTKSIKYLLPLLSLVGLGLCFGFYYWTNYKYPWVLIVPIAIDLSVRYFFYRFLKQKEKDRSVLFVKHRRWMNQLGLHWVFLFLFLAAIVFLVFVAKSEALTVFGFVILGYMSVQGAFFYNNFDGYLLTEQGINQFGYFEKNYPWNEIEDICVTEKALYITIAGSERITGIETGMADRVMIFLNLYHIAYRS